MRSAGLKLAVIVATLQCLFLGTAQATIIVSSSGTGVGALTNYPGEVLIADFDGFLAPGWTLSGTYEIRNTTSGLGALPAGDLTNYLNTRPGFTPAILTSVTPFSTLSFYAGSLDDYNLISFYYGGSLIQGFTGANIGALLGFGADGNQSSSNTNRRINFAFSGILPDEVRFGSNGIAFEIDNVADVTTAAVPEPASLAIFGTGFLSLFGFWIIRRPRMAKA